MSEFDQIFRSLVTRIMLHGEEVEVGEWQSQDVRDKPEMISRELTHEQFKMHVPGMPSIFAEIPANQPWAEDHFQERVSGEPLNPPPSEAYWPYAVRGNQDHTNEAHQFSHTYPERFWPKFANFHGTCADSDRVIHVPHIGTRFGYGDLADVVALLTRSPLTRQAYLPVWFPEDTGAVAGQRVPCTLGYRFLLRGGRLDITYDIRSCDLLRHFTDDVYLACRLLQWVVGKLQGNGIDARPGLLIMNISSLHVFRGDYYRLNQMISKWEEDEDEYGAAV